MCGWVFERGSAQARAEHVLGQLELPAAAGDRRPAHQRHRLQPWHRCGDRILGHDLMMRLGDVEVAAEDLDVGEPGTHGERVTREADLVSELDAALEQIDGAVVLPEHLRRPRPPR